MQVRLPIQAALVAAMLAATTVGQNSATAYFDRIEYQIVQTAQCGTSPERTTTLPLQTVTTAQAAISFSSADVTCLGLSITGTANLQASSTPTPAAVSSTIVTQSPLNLRFSQQTSFSRTAAAVQLTPQTSGTFPFTACVMPSDNSTIAGAIPAGGGSTTSNYSGSCDFSNLGAPFSSVEHHRFTRVSMTFFAYMVSASSSNRVQVEVRMSIVHRLTFPLVKLDPATVNVSIPIQSSAPVTGETILSNSGGHPLEWRIASTPSGVTASPTTGPALLPGESIKITFTITFARAEGVYTLGAVPLVTNQAPTFTGYRPPFFPADVTIRATVGGQAPEPPSSVDFTSPTPARGSAVEQDTPTSFSALVQYSHLRQQPTAVALELLDQDSKRLALSALVRVATGTGNELISIPGFVVDVRTTRILLRAILTDVGTGQVIRASTTLEFTVTGKTGVTLGLLTVGGVPLNFLRNYVVVSEYQDPKTRFPGDDPRTMDLVRLEARYSFTGDAQGTIVFVASTRDADGTMIQVLEYPETFPVRSGTGAVTLDIAPEFFHFGYETMEWIAELRLPDGRIFRSDPAEFFYEIIRFRRCTPGPDGGRLAVGTRVELACEVKLSVRREGVTLGYRLEDNPASTLVDDGPVAPGFSGFKLVKVIIEKVPDSAEWARVRFYLNGPLPEYGPQRALSAPVSYGKKAPAAIISRAGDFLSGFGARVTALRTDTARTIETARQLRALGFSASDLDVFRRTPPKNLNPAASGGGSRLEPNAAGILMMRSVWRFEPPVQFDSGFEADVVLDFAPGDFPLDHPEFDPAKLRIYSFDPDSGEYRDFPATIDLVNGKAAARLTGLPSVVTLGMPGPLRQAIVGSPIAWPDALLTTANLGSERESLAVAGLSSAGSEAPFQSASVPLPASQQSSVAVVPRLFPRGVSTTSSWVAALSLASGAMPAILAGGKEALALRAGAQDWILPAVVWDSGPRTPEIHIANLSGFETTAIVDLFGAGGASAGSTEVRLSAWGKSGLAINSEFPDLSAPFAGWARIRATSGVVAAVVLPGADDFALLSPTTERSQAPQWTIPYFQSGNGALDSRLVLLNPGTETVRVTVRAFSDAAGSFGSSEIVLKPGEQIMREVGELLSLDRRIRVSGALRIDGGSGSPGLIAAMLYESVITGRKGRVADSAGATRQVMMFNNAIDNGIAAAELAFAAVQQQQTATVALRAFSAADGSPLSAAREKVLPAGGGWSGTLGSWIPEAQAFTGSGYVLVEASVPVVAYGQVGSRDIPFIAIPAASSTTPPPQSQLSFSPATLDFGAVPRDQTRTLRLAVSTSQSVTITPITFSDPQFRLAPGTALPLTVTGSASLDVVFAPAPSTAVGPTLNATMIFSNGQRLTLTGSVAPPSGATTPRVQIRITPTSLDFGDVPSGQNRDLSLSISNGGTESLTITGAEISSPRFQLRNTSFPLTVLSAGTQVLQVRFSPVAAGVQSGTLTFASNDPATPSAAVNLRGNGTGVAAAPRLVSSAQVLDFGTVRVNQRDERTFEIRNTGDAPLIIQSLTFEDPSYAAGPPTPFTLASGAIADIGVVFAPRSVGGHNTTLRIVSNDPASPLLIPVTGTAQP